MREILIKIRSNGIQPNLPLELKQNLEISNIFNVIDIFLVFPFIILFRHSPLAALLTAMPILFHTLSFVLIRYHKYDLGRFIYSITTATTVYFVAALIYNDGGTDGMAAKFLIHGTIIMPFIVFTKKEWKFTLMALLLDLFYIISFNYMNGLLSLPNIQNVDGPALRLISIITTFILFATIFFYYKKLIIEQSVKLEQSNNDFIERNAELRELNATKNKFFTIIAHDLKSPFNVILGFARMLKENHKKLSAEKLELYTENLLVTSENTYKLVENLLNWSCSQLKRNSNNPVTIYVNNFVADTISKVQDVANLKEISIINKVDKNIYAEVDENEVSVVLQNILSNAIKFSYRQKTITISSKLEQKEADSFIEICIADSGVGMSSDQVTDLFKIENAISCKGTENEQGTGLGLLICKEFIEKNSGQIRVESELSKGSKFYITLPSIESQSYNNDSLISKKEHVCIA